MAYRDILERADAFFAEVAAEQPQNLQCGRGCSFCCHGLFEIGSGDVAVIAEGLEKLHPMRRKKVIRARRGDSRHGRTCGMTARGVLRPDRIDVACPNLDENGACMMYEHRPMVCRTFGLPIRDGARYIGDICELNFTEAPQAEKEPAAWDLQWEDVYGEDEFPFPKRSCWPRACAAGGGGRRFRVAENQSDREDFLLCKSVPLNLCNSRSPLRRDVGDVRGFSVAHDAVALEDGAFFDDQGRRVDVAVDLAVAVDLDACVGDDLADDGAADGDAADVDVAFDVRALADDQLVLRVDLSVELAVDAHGVLELELALET